MGYVKVRYWEWKTNMWPVHTVEFDSQNAGRSDVCDTVGEAQLLDHLA